MTKTTLLYINTFIEPTEVKIVTDHRNYKYFNNNNWSNIVAWTLPKIYTGCSLVRNTEKESSQTMCINFLGISRQNVPITFIHTETSLS